MKVPGRDAAQAIGNRYLMKETEEVLFLSLVTDEQPL